MKWKPEMPQPAGEIGVAVVDRQGRRRAIDLEVERRTIQGLYGSFGIDLEVPAYSFHKEIIDLLRNKMVLRPFETLLWMPEKSQRPSIDRLLPRPDVPHYMAPEFSSGLNAGILAAAEPRRPKGPYVLFTTAEPAVESWTKGKDAGEINKILRPLRESGLTLPEYLMIERLSTQELVWQDENAERMDEGGAVMILGTPPPDGNILFVHNSVAGQMSFGAASAEVRHPKLGARVGAVIPLET